MDALSESPQLFDEPTNEPDDPVPSAPPPLYPVLAGDTPDGPASPSQVDTDHTPTASPMVYRSQSDFNMQRVRALLKHLCDNRRLSFFLSLSLSLCSNILSLPKLLSNLKVWLAKW